MQFCKQTCDRKMRRICVEQAVIISHIGRKKLCGWFHRGEERCVCLYKILPCNIFEKSFYKM